MPSLNLKHADAANGFVVLAFTDEAGQDYELKLSTIDAASLIAALNFQIREIAQSPDAQSHGLPGMCRVQYSETPETLFFRVFLSEHLYHEYELPRRTDLAEELMAFADRWEARQEAKATHLPPDTGRKQ